jgi:UDP-GlcNAc:undecaprenyl-phosphate GlcNAc-1-phosphate transferase
MTAAAGLVANWGDYAWFYAALVLILATGALDDRFGVPPRVKFLLQILAAVVVVVLGHAQVVDLGDLFGTGTVWLGWFSIPFSIIAAVLLINAINLMDGLDGLAGGMGVIVMGSMALCALFEGGIHSAGEMFTLCAALAGFLFYNMRGFWRARACVFLGDAGSLALGLTFSWYAIRLAGHPQPLVHPTSVAWILGLPIMDTCGQFARRVCEGRHPFSADQDHLHHHFVRIGLTPGRATAAVLSVIALYAAIGVFGIAAGIPSYYLMYVWAAILLCHIWLSMHPDTFRRLIAGALRVKS